MFLKINYKKIGLNLFIFIAIFTGVFLITAYEMPKYKGFMFSFLLLILSDFYLWNHYKQFIIKQIMLIRLFLMFLFWLAMILSFVFFFSALFSNIKDWNPVFRTYLTGFILVLYLSKLIAVMFLLVADLLRFLKFAFTFLFKRNRFTQKFSNKRWKFLLIVGNFCSFSLFIMLLWGMIFTEFDFQVRKVSINSERIPQSFKGMKIVQISDIHLGSWYGKKPLQRAVNMINELKPDLIFFTGDMVNYSTKETQDYVDVLKQLRAKKGIFAILGNHDYGDYVKWNSADEKQKNMQDLEDFYKQISWILLKNENIRIQSDSSFISIVGVENWGKDARFPKKGDIEKALHGIDSNDYTILLSHDPTHFQTLISLQYPQIDLCLSGHTHGMQMGISTDNFEWSPAQLQYKYWGGLYENQNHGKKQLLYVNRGLGVIGYPGRIGIKPEITLFELN